MDGSLQDFIATYDLFDRGVRQIAPDEAGRVRIAFEMFHVDDPARNDETKQYRLTVLFRPEDVTLAEGELRHEGPGWLGTVLDFEAEGDLQRLGIEWRHVGDDDYSWTALLLRGGPVAVNEVVTDL